MLRLTLGTLSALTAFSFPAQGFTCADAQRSILNLAADKLDELSIDNQEYQDKNAFIQSKPSLTQNQLTTRSFLEAEGEFEQLWCKLKSQEAVTGSLKTESQGPVKSCASLHQRLLEEAHQKLDPTSSESLEDLGIVLLDDKEFKTGAQWAPSQVYVAAKDARYELQATRLHSPTWIPVIGGMNYCKLLSPKGAETLIQKAKERKESPQDQTALKVQTIEWNLGGIKGKQSALFYYQDSIEATLNQAKGIYIISPGGEVPPEAMSGLAAGFHKQGFASFVVRYPSNLAIVDTFTGRGNSALNLAQRLRQDPSSLSGLSVSAPFLSDIRIFGHSLGGATLADEIYKAEDQRVVSHIVLYGTGQFVKFPGNSQLPPKPLAILFGQNDGLARGSMPGFLKSFGMSFNADDFSVQTSPLQEQVVFQQIPDINHFCIISDQTVGNGMLKKKDGKGLEPDQCVNALLSALSQIKFL